MRTRLPLLAVWLVTRALLVLMLLDRIHISSVPVLSDVATIYHAWYQDLLAGTFPVHDVTWQYPPLAALVILAPGVLPTGLGYVNSFVALALLFDALGLAVLMRRAGPRQGAAWYWVAGIALVGPTVYARYDIVVTVVAVIGVILLLRRERAVAGGAVAALGALLKVWPALILVGTQRKSPTRRAWASAAVTVVALCGAAAAAAPGAFSFLSAQGARGVEIESLGGTVLELARVVGAWPGRINYQYGSIELVGPLVRTTADASLVLTAVAAGWLLLWRVRARRIDAAATADAALTAMLLFVLTSRVISPQYLIWLVGLAAVCLTVRGSSQRPVAYLLLPAAGLTVLEFPVLFLQVQGGQPFGVAVLAARNALLLAAALLSCARLWRATMEAPTPPLPETGGGPLDPPGEREAQPEGREELRGDPATS